MVYVLFVSVTGPFEAHDTGACRAYVRIFTEFVDFSERVDVNPRTRALGRAADRRREHKTKTDLRTFRAEEP